MTDLIRDGKILHWGISEAIEEYLRRAHAVCPVIAVQEPLFDDGSPIRKMFPLLEELDMGLVASRHLQTGCLRNVILLKHDLMFEWITVRYASIPDEEF